MMEPRIERWDLLTDALMKSLVPLVRGNVAFFGHSLGGLVAYEMAKRLAPTAVFLSSTRAAHVFHRTARRKYADMSEAELIQDLTTLGGTPRECLEDPELRDLVLPVVRSDYRLVDNYNFVPTEKLGMPLHVYGGRTDDETDPDSLAAWAELTSKVSDVKWFDGGHFYLFEQTDALLADLRAKLEALA
jgi:medium-chain acyl-[acyl-carrier-protein] hydrolase